jgi:transcription antitermination factor NusG
MTVHGICDSRERSLPVFDQETLYPSIFQDAPNPDLRITGNTSESQPFPWYAVRVRSRFEQVASASLRSKGYEEFVPLVATRRRWSDRTRDIAIPLFPGYVFCRFDASRRVPILESPGVVNVLACGSRLTPIPDEEIQAIQTMLQSSLPVEPYPFMQAGRKIRIERGPLAGLEGVVVEVKKQFRIVASVTLLQRSVSTEIERDWISAL